MILRLLSKGYIVLLVSFKLSNISILSIILTVSINYVVYT